MSDKTNRHGLSRTIPDPVMRQIRQESGFGCVVCVVMAFANRLLLSVPEAANSRSAWPRRVVAGLGYRIIEKLRGFTLEMWVVHERTLAAASEPQR
jgi:hypothetical protein